MTNRKAIKTSTRLALAATLLAVAALTGCNADASSSEPFRPVLASTFNGEAVSNLGATYAYPTSHHAPQPHESYTHSGRHAL